MADPKPLLDAHQLSTRSLPTGSVTSPQSRRSSFSVDVGGNPDDEIQHMSTSKYLGMLYHVA